MNKKIRAISLSLAVAIALTSVNTYATVTKAETLNNKENFKIEKLSNDLQDIEYSYVENGETYLMKEIMSKDLKSAKNTLYKRDNNGNYIEVSSSTLKLGNETIIIETNTNGVISTKRLPLNVKVEETDLGTSQINPRMDEIGAGSGGVSWRYDNTLTYSSDVRYCTVSAIIIIISAIAPAVTGGLLGPTASTIVGGIANMVYQKGYSTIYYKKENYSGRNWEGIITCTKSATTVYSDAARTKKIGNTILDFYYAK